MSEFDYDAFTQQLKVKLAEDKTPKPSRTLHLEFAGDPFDPLTAVNIRHIRAAVRGCPSLHRLDTLFFLVADH